jgi:hypothetical protein
MRFQVLVQGEPRHVQLAIVSEKDLAFVGRWRAPAAVTTRPAVRDTLEFGRLASKRWRYYRRSIAPPTNLADFKSGVAKRGDGAVKARRGTATKERRPVLRAWTTGCESDLEEVGAPVSAALGEAGRVSLLRPPSDLHTSSPRSAASVDAPAFGVRALERRFPCVAKIPPLGKGHLTRRLASRTERQSTARTPTAAISRGEVRSPH